MLMVQLPLRGLWRLLLVVLLALVVLPLLLLPLLLLPASTAPVAFIILTTLMLLLWESLASLEDLRCCSC
jgi:hypothetical protein